MQEFDQLQIDGLEDKTKQLNQESLEKLNGLKDRCAEAIQTPSEVGANVEHGANYRQSEESHARIELATHLTGTDRPLVIENGISVRGRLHG
jgi:hypothetical protein